MEEIRKPRPVKVIVEPDRNMFHDYSRQTITKGEFDKTETWPEFTERVNLAIRQTQLLYEGS